MHVPLSLKGFYMLPSFICKTLKVMGDRSGSIRWWDVTTGLSSSFNTHRDGIRRIKFSPIVSGDHSRGRIAVLFHDNTFSIFDLVCVSLFGNKFSYCIFLWSCECSVEFAACKTEVGTACSPWTNPCHFWQDKYSTSTNHTGIRIFS